MAKCESCNKRWVDNIVTLENGYMRVCRKCWNSRAYEQTQKFQELSKPLIVEKLETDDLIRIAHIEKENYTSEAIKFALKELNKRGLGACFTKDSIEKIKEEIKQEEIKQYDRIEWRENMNRNQRLILIIGLTLFILMGLFPPWTETFKIRSTYSENPVGYHPIFSPPVSNNRLSIGYKLDVSRLIIQWITVLGACGIAWFLSSKEKT